MRPPRHPVGEQKAAWFHGGLVVYFTFGLLMSGLGIWFHGVSWKRHRDAWRRGE